MSGRGVEQAGPVETAVDCAQNGQDINPLLEEFTSSQQSQFIREYSQERRNGTTFDAPVKIGMDVQMRRTLDQPEPAGGFNGTCELPELTIEDNGRPYEPLEPSSDQILSEVQAQEGDSSFDFLLPSRQERIQERAGTRSESIGQQAEAILTDESNADAQISLREQLLGLTPGSEVTAQVMENIENQFPNTSLPDDIESHVDITYATDSQGNEIKSRPLQVDIYDRFNNGTPTESIDLTKSLDQMASEARQHYYEEDLTSTGAAERELYRQDHQKGLLDTEDKLWFDRVLDRDS